MRRPAMSARRQSMTLGITSRNLRRILHGDLQLDPNKIYCEGTTIEDDGRVGPKFCNTAGALEIVLRTSQICVCW